MKRSVLILASHLFIGGAETVIANLGCRLDRSRFRVRICCLKEMGNIGNDLLSRGIDVFTLSNQSSQAKKYFSFLMVRKIVKELKIDILHSHTTDTLIDASLCKTTMPRVKVVHTFHFGNYPHYRKRYLMLEKLFCRVPDRLVAVGLEQREKISSTFNVSKRNIDVIWNGVAPPRVDSRRRMADDGCVRIGTVATLIEQKGLHSLIEVARKMKRRGKRAKFLIAGEGRLRTDLEGKVRQLGLSDSVTFLGWVDNANSTFIPYIDIFFLPSLWEAMSMVVIEAMVAGKPVVVTDVGDNRHLIDEGWTGFLAAPGDVDRLAALIETLIDNPVLRSDVGWRAGKRAKELCSVESMIRQYESLYDHVVDHAQRKPLAAHAASRFMQPVKSRPKRV